MEICKLNDENNNDDRQAELAQLEARVAELRQALGKGCIGSCTGCPYAEICNNKSPDEPEEDALCDEEPDDLNEVAKDHDVKNNSNKENVDDTKKSLPRKRSKKLRYFLTNLVMMTP